MADKAGAEVLTIVGRRLGTALLTFLLSSFLIFSALRLVPGDPVGALTQGRRLKAEQIEALRQQYGLDEPFFSSYFQWLGGVLHLDFGNSLLYQRDIGALIWSRLAVSAPLIIYAATLTVLFGVLVALFAAAKGGAFDRATIYVSSVATATPPFLSAVVLISLFSVRLGWFPSIGAGDGFADRLYHLTLPAIALAVSSFGVMARLSRAIFLEQLNREHVEVAHSRGLPFWATLRRHVLRNSLGPILTLVALLLATLFVGTAVVESAFGLDGVGALLVQSVSKRDLPVVQGISLCAVALFIISSTVVDLLQTVIDPRLRNQKKAAA